MPPSFDSHSPRYLLIGHVTLDQVIVDAEPSAQPRTAFGGTATYSGLTAAAYGSDVRLLTSCRNDYARDALAPITTHRKPSSANTQFENRYEHGARSQVVASVAEFLSASDLPSDWRAAEIVHLAPVIGEVEPAIFDSFPQSLRCATLQGWMRNRGTDNSVRKEISPSAYSAAEKASAAVFSVEDVDNDETLIEKFAEACSVLAVTEGAGGCRVYWNRHVRRIPAPQKKEVDPTGAGDIFAAVFFLRYFETRDPFEAGRMAVQLASNSITRPGLEGIPTRGEILEAKLVIEKL